MQNALEILGREQTPSRVAILGDMKELGETSAQYHRAVAQQILDNRIDTVFLAGPEMRYAYETLQKAGGVDVTYALQPKEWMTKLRQVLKRPNTTCLIKASRSMNFENILKEI